MGLFSRKKENADAADNSPVYVCVHSFESKTNSEIVADCEIKKGNVRVGDRLTYRPRFGRDAEATVEGITSMMMDLQRAMEGTAATITLSGDFHMLTPSEDDSIIRE